MRRKVVSDGRRVTASFTTPLAASSNQMRAVIVDVATSPSALVKVTALGTPNNSYGFIRFKVKVN